MCPPPTPRMDRGARPIKEAATEPTSRLERGDPVNLSSQEYLMDWNEEPATPAPTPISPPTNPGGWRRGVATVALAAGLLLVGGAAVVSAASPDPSGSPAPSASTQPTDPGTGGRSHTGKDCPAKDGSGGSGGSQTPNASPDASPDASSSNA